MFFNLAMINKHPHYSRETTTPRRNAYHWHNTSYVQESFAICSKEQQSWSICLATLGSLNVLQSSYDQQTPALFKGNNHTTAQRIPLAQHFLCPILCNNDYASWGIPCNAFIWRRPAPTSPHNYARLDNSDVEDPESRFQTLGSASSK